MRKRLPATMVAVMAVVMSAGPGAPTAEAAFPGHNGPIAFSSGRDGNVEVYVMDADGQHQSNLANTTASDDFGPAFSPDGTKIAFTSTRDGNHEVYVMDADGQHQTNLTNHPGADSGPAFSPDGDKIAPMATRSPSIAAATATSRSR